MNIQVEIGEAPPATEFEHGVLAGSVVRRKYKTEDIARFEADVAHKKDEFTRGFLKGLKDGRTAT